MIDDFEGLLTKHGFSYEKKGYTLKCLCPNPYHDDKHIGSFSINLNKGVGHCFACGFNCNITVLNHIFGEKVSHNTKSNPYFNTSFKRFSNKVEKTISPIKVIGVLRNPFENYKIHDYLKSIGWNDSFVEMYDVKYSEYSEMISEELYYQDDTTKILNRIVIPIRYNDKIVSYECRSYNGTTPKVLYPKGSYNNFIFNMENVDLSKPVVLTEGIKNLGKCWSIYKNVVSSFGNQLSDEKLKILNTIPSLILFMDYDDGGYTMLHKLIENYKGDLKVAVCKKKYLNEHGEVKGYDLNDLSEKEIKFYLTHLNNPEEVDKIKTVQKIEW